MIDSESAKAPRTELNWAASKTIGGNQRNSRAFAYQKGMRPWRTSHL